ncbi:MAG: tetratricopeptide repeat protein [Desulfobacteraceae bacterium]|jgi:tetratricopeptide (TPR) repeat protein|nr:tetratricopeptide repeat protein [Desulfobacteraceae bacterium]
MTYEKKILISLVLIWGFLSLFSGCSLTTIDNKRAMFLYQDGILLSSKGDFDGALEKFNASIRISEENGFADGVAHNYNEIGNIYTYKNKFDIAREYYQKALSIYEEKNMAPEVSKSMDNIAKTYLRQGDYVRTLEQYETLLSWDKASGNRLGAGITNYNMALICEKYTMAHEKAKQYYQDALDIFLSLDKEKEALEAQKGIQRMTF